MNIKKNNKDKVKTKTVKRRARKLDLDRGATVSVISLRERDGDQCFFCEVSMDFETYKFEDGRNNPLYVSLEHLLPLSMGGLHTDMNLVLSCLGCNTSKQDKSLESFLDTLENPSQQALILADALYHQPNLLDHFMDLSYNPEAIKRFEVYSL